MIVVGVADDDSIDDGKVLDLAWNWRIALWTQPRERRAAVFEDWVEEDAQT